MRLQTAFSALGLAFGLALAAAPAAVAADFSRDGGSIKDRGGVAIPAPIPIAESFKWYLRADVGGGMLTGGDPSTTGNITGFDRDPLDGPAFGVLSGWFNNGFDTFMVGGLGAGVYLSPRFRTDLTVDTRTKSDLKVDGGYQYRGDPLIYDNPPGTGFEARITGRTRENIEVRGTAFLGNIYWDLTERGSRFVPYIGIGAGFVVRSIQRTHTTTQQLWDMTTNAPTPTLAGTNTFTGKSKAHQVAPAAAAMAGVGWTLSNGMVLDLNYRFTYLGSVDASMDIEFAQPQNGVAGATSKLTVGDTFEHALRAGVRWNVW